MKLTIYLTFFFKLRKNGAKYLFPLALMAWYLIKHRDVLTFPFVRF